MLKERLGSIHNKATKGIKGKGKHYGLSYILEEKYGKQRRTDVLNTLFSFNLALINRFYCRIRKCKLPRVTILRLPELMKLSVLRP